MQQCKQKHRNRSKVAVVIEMHGCKEASLCRKELAKKEKKARYLLERDEHVRKVG